MKKMKFGSAVLLLLAAFIWGVAFVAQSVGMDYVGPFTFNGCRFLLGGLVLTPFAWVRDRKYEQSASFPASLACSTEPKTNSSERFNEEQSWLV